MSSSSENFDGGNSAAIAGTVNSQLFQSREERLAAGRAMREIVPRESHAEWKADEKRRDPVALLEASNQNRLPELVPIRHRRMLQSPFTFLRGSAGLMAHDLATTPTTGIQVQACGDCHLLNFGLFATPERNLTFDINDFDETLPAPWEWDIKRLAASFAVASREYEHSDKKSRVAAVECARAYRENLREYSKMSPLEVWYYRLDEQRLLDLAPDPEKRQRRKEIMETAKLRIGEYLFPKISNEVGGRRVLIDEPPLLFHIRQDRDAEFQDIVHDALESYRTSLPDDRRVLFDRYRLVDIAVKVVGIGSVGTRCFVGLFFSAENHPLLLQFKEANSSTLEPWAGKSLFNNHGQRVVTGQRLMQSSSDIFLGWTRTRRGRDYFVRQLRDMKYTPQVEASTSREVRVFADLCGRTLARAHAKSGDAAMISGYLGKSPAFDEAIGEFSLAYAEQTEKDYVRLQAAVKAGRIKAAAEGDA